LGQNTWQVLVSLWVQLYFIGGIALLAKFYYGRMAVGRFIYGRARCPECALVYDRPLFGLNFGPRRYERCPVCKRWHWMKLSSDVPDEDTVPESKEPPRTSVNDIMKDNQV
jgi:hypothetical protein